MMKNKIKFIFDKLLENMLKLISNKSSKFIIEHFVI